MKKHHRIHNLVAIILGVLACLVFVVASMTAWFHQTVLVTDRFVGVVADVTSDPVVIDRLSVQLSDQILERLAIQQRLEELLPDRLDRLAVTITEAIGDRITSAANQLLTNEQLQGGLDSSLSLLHSRLVSVLRGDAENVQIANGTLTIDLLAIVQEIIAQLQADGVLPSDVALPDLGLIDDREAFVAQLSTALGAQLPPDFGQVQIADATRLQQLSTLVQQADLAVAGLVIASLLLIVFTVVWAHRRPRAVFFIALGIEVLIVLVALGLIGAQGIATDSLASADGRPVLSAFVAGLAGSLTLWLAWTGILVLVVAVVAAVVGLLFAGRHRTEPEPT